eukprot:755158-Hanusia_phi.AAC.2
MQVNTQARLDAEGADDEQFTCSLFVKSSILYAIEKRQERGSLKDIRSSLSGRDRRRSVEVNARGRSKWRKPAPAGKRHETAPQPPPFRHLRIVGGVGGPAQDLATLAPQFLWDLNLREPSTRLPSLRRGT